MSLRRRISDRQVRTFKSVMANADGFAAGSGLRTFIAVHNCFLVSFPFTWPFVAAGLVLKTGCSLSQVVVSIARRLEGSDTNQKC
jgi:hypothetical protein